MEAVRAGAVGLVRALIKRGANVNAADSKRFYPIHFAAEGGFLEVTLIKYILFLNNRQNHSQASWLAREFKYLETNMWLVIGSRLYLLI